MADAKLRVDGWLGSNDEDFFSEQCARIEAAGLGGDFHHDGSPDRAEKCDFLRGLDVFSVPTSYREPKGLYVLEALAAGVPVVQPDHGAFPEWITATGGGLLVPPDDTATLADALAALLGDPVRRRALGDSGRRAVGRDFTAAKMAQATLGVWHEIRSRAIG